MIELLVALTISATLMAAMMVALDVMFKRYTAISDQASTHVITRTVMHRMLAMIRTGTRFGPYPTDVTDRTTNPADYNRIQFISQDDVATNTREITTIESRAAGTVSLGGMTVMQRGPNVLWLVVERSVAGTVSTVERPLIDGVVTARFNLEYVPGPRLKRATIDLTVLAQGNSAEVFDRETSTWSSTSTTGNGAGATTVNNSLMHNESGSPVIRMVASVAPRSDW